MGKYFDNLKIRKKVNVRVGEIDAYSYEDNYMGEWVGNINLYKNNRIIFHATTKAALTEDELKEFVEEYVKKGA